MELIRQKACRNPAWPDAGKLGAANIVGHAPFKTKSGLRQRCLCKTWGNSFSANTGGHSRSTIERWLERAAVWAKCFNDERLGKFEIGAIQTDELPLPRFR